MSGIPTTFDALIQRVAQGIPLAFIKSLIFHESGMKPAARPVNSKGKVVSSATGLGQILEPALEGFNKANGYKYTMKDMEDPEKNLMVTVWLIKLIIKTYKENTKLVENWDDPNWIGFLYMGYTAGYSTKQGVAYLVSTMEKKGIPANQITPETVRLLAMKLFPSSKIYNNGGGYMSEPLLMKSINNKTRDYFALRGMPIPPPWSAPAMYSPPAASSAPTSSSSAARAPVAPAAESQFELKRIWKPLALLAGAGALGILAYKAGDNGRRSSRAA
jgi:hypothetical protein